MRKFFILCFAFMVWTSAFAQNRGYEPVVIDIDGIKTKLYNESHALVIGMSDYTAGWPSLAGVKKDVNAVTLVLEQVGFNVVLKENLTKDETDKAFVDFISKYGQDPENRLLFYFAGHGHTVKTSFGEVLGYIVPVDAPNPNMDLTGFQSKSMPMSRIEEYAKLTQSKHAIFFFDACFSGSLFSLSRAVPEVINYKTSKPVRQFITSGSEDETVPDESIFRQQFVMALTTLYADANNDGYLTGSELGKYLQDNVINYSHNNQHPQYGKIRNQYLDKGDYVFVIDKSVGNNPDTYNNINNNTNDIKRSLGNIILYSEIKGDLYVDNKKKGTVNPGSDIPVSNLAPGKHTLKIEGTLTWTKVVTVKKGETIKVRAKKSELKDNSNLKQFTDNRDGKKYKLVKIGGQLWMAENLAYKTKEACWPYNEEEDNIDKYGYLYLWTVAKDVCPEGFHLPSEAEWKKLEKYINEKDGPFKTGPGSYYEIGKILKAKNGWNNDANGTDKYGFNAQPGGYCLSFEGETTFFQGGSGGTGGRWWSSTLKNTTIVWARSISSRNDKIHKVYIDGKTWAFSVRCIKD